MAITVHQSKWAGEASGVSSLAVTFDSNPTAGRAVIVGAWNYDDFDVNLIVSVTDNQGNTYTPAVQNTVGLGGSSIIEVVVYSCLNIASSGAFTVTVTLNASGFPNIAVMEVSGLLSSGALDQIGSEDNTSGTDASPSTSGATTEAVELAVAAFVLDTGSVSAVSATNYTNFGEQPNGAGWLVGAASYRILSVTGVETASYSHNDGTNASVIATFKALTVAGNKMLTLLGAG